MVNEPWTWKQIAAAVGIGLFGVAEVVLVLVMVGLALA